MHKLTTDSLESKTHNYTNSQILPCTWQIQEIILFMGVKVENKQVALTASLHIKLDKTVPIRFAPNKQSPHENE